MKHLLRALALVRGVFIVLFSLLELVAVQPVLSVLHILDTRLRQRHRGCRVATGDRARGCVLCHRGRDTDTVDLGSVPCTALRCSLGGRLLFDLLQRALHSIRRTLRGAGSTTVACGCGSGGGDRRTRRVAPSALSGIPGRHSRGRCRNTTTWGGGASSCCNRCTRWTRGGRDSRGSARSGGGSARRSRGKVRGGNLSFCARSTARAGLPASLGFSLSLHRFRGGARRNCDKSKVNGINHQESNHKINVIQTMV